MIINDTIIKNDTNEEITSWDDLPDVKSELLRGIYSYGFENPSPIQQKGIIPLFNKNDVHKHNPVRENRMFHYWNITAHKY